MPSMRKYPEMEQPVQQIRDGFVGLSLDPREMDPHDEQVLDDLLVELLEVLQALDTFVDGT